MHADAQAAAGDVEHGGVDVLDLAARRTPVVDHEEHVGAPHARRHAVGGSPPPEFGRGVDAEVAEKALAFGDQLERLGQDPPDPLRVVPARDAADVRGALERLQRSAAEVEAEELRLVRRVGEHGGQKQGPQKGALARLRGADQHQVAVLLREVRHQGLLELPDRDVHDADGEPELALVRPPLGGHAAYGLDRYRAGQRVQRQRRGQRGQPHLVGWLAGNAEPFDDDLHLGPSGDQRAGPLVLPLAGVGLGVWRHAQAEQDGFGGRRAGLERPLRGTLVGP